MLLDHCIKDWNAINWRLIQNRVSHLRHRIYRASEAGDLKKVRNLQRLMMRSTANKLLAIRQVTQRNHGKSTPGVDGFIAMTHQDRLEVYEKLQGYHPEQVLPVKRIYIPKTNGKKRPLGINTIIDRCQQTVVKAALEPYWEAHFEPTSYGFRPGRCTHDAIARVFNAVKPNGSRVWILDADIEGAFDNIAHKPLMESIGNFPGRRWIKSWLTSGIMEQGKFSPTESGVPQGGPLSPLLLNIALHGLEAHLGVRYEKSGKVKAESPCVITRYADDMLVMAKDKSSCQETMEKLKAWLKPRGLTLSEEKTSIRHVEDGVDFLGVNIKRYTRVGKKKGKVLLIMPSKAAMQNFRKEVRAIWKQLVSAPQGYAIGKLNNKLIGWGNYYRPYASKRAFGKLDNWMWLREVRYRYNRHSRKPWHWCRNRYWGKIPKRKANWVFRDPKTGQYLYQLGWIPIYRHKMVKGRNSPDDPKMRVYWQKRRKEKALSQMGMRSKLWERQNGVCSVCKGELDNGEELHVHHIKPQSEGGGNNLSNLCIIHGACHRQIHSNYGEQLKLPLAA